MRQPLPPSRCASPDHRAPSTLYTSTRRPRVSITSLTAPKLDSPSPSLSLCNSRRKLLAHQSGSAGENLTCSPIAVASGTGGSPAKNKLIPTPTTTSEEDEVRHRIPASFLPPTRTSLGHFSVASLSPSALNERITARPAMRGIHDTLSAERGAEGTTVLRARDSPERAHHCRSFRPRPATWWVERTVV